MWKPKYFQTITTMIAGRTQTLSASTKGGSQAEAIADGRHQAVVAVIDEVPDQARRDFGQHVGHEEEQPQRR